MTTDHLNSPRVITNENGVVTTRKDYTAFGEVSYTAERTAGLGYSGAEETRKGYTGYEKDDESGLDFAQARYYNSVHGRFTSVDPLSASASIRNPQTFNRYSYVLNSPYKYTDPLGLIEECRTCSASGLSTQSIDQHRAEEEERRKKEEEERRRRKALKRQQQARPPQPPPPTRKDTYQIRYQTFVTSVVQGEEYRGREGLYGAIKEAIFAIEKNGVALTPETAGDATIEESVENISTTITDEKGETVDAPQALKDRISDSSTEGQYPIFDSRGRPFGDSQELTTNSKESFDTLKRLNFTAVDKVSFTLRVKGEIVRSITILSTKKIDSITIEGVRD